MSCATAWRAVSSKGAGQGSSRLCCRGAALVVVDGTGMGQIAANGPAATQRMPLAWPERSPGNEYVVENEVINDCRDLAGSWSALFYTSMDGELQKFQ